MKVKNGIPSHKKIHYLATLIGPNLVFQEFAGLTWEVALGRSCNWPFVAGPFIIKVLSEDQVDETRRKWPLVSEKVKNRRIVFLEELEWWQHRFERSWKYSETKTLIKADKPLFTGSTGKKKLHLMVFNQTSIETACLLRVPGSSI